MRPHLRSWLGFVGAAGGVCAPGLALDFLIGKPTPSVIGYSLNLLVVALGSGLVWGTLLFGASAVVARFRRGPA